MASQDLGHSLRGLLVAEAFQGAGLAFWMENSGVALLACPWCSCPPGGGRHAEHDSLVVQFAAVPVGLLSITEVGVVPQEALHSGIGISSDLVQLLDVLICLKLGLLASSRS